MGQQKSILNGKVYDLFSIIDLEKINNWNEIKGQSTWINVAFKDQNEISNNSHICFPFVTRSLNYVPSFSIYLQDDKNKEIEFNSGEQKVSIFNFQVDIYLRWTWRSKNKTAQQVKDEQINFILEDVEKKLEGYKKSLELRDKQISDAIKKLLSAKKSYDKIVAENKELRAYIETLRDKFTKYQQQQQAPFLEQ